MDPQANGSGLARVEVLAAANRSCPLGAYQCLQQGHCTFCLGVEVSAAHAISDESCAQCNHGLSKGEWEGGEKGHIHIIMPSGAGSGLSYAYGFLAFSP